MGFKQFIDDLQPNQKNRNQLKEEILKILKVMDSDLEIYWYPGSGPDITPLLFDVPNNPTGRRLLRMDNESSGQPPIFLWMNDYADLLADFPKKSQLNQATDNRYSELWNRYQASSLFCSKEIYSLGSQYFTLFLVNIKNADQGSYSRPPQGDNYIALFSNLKSENLLDEVFSKYKIKINTIALIKQGGFSGQTFGHYNLPKILKRHRDKIGSVDFWIIDSQGVDLDSEKRVIPRGLEEYEYIGGPVPWGWEPTRLFGRKQK